MEIVNLLLIDIIEKSEIEFQYKLMDLDYLTQFEIADTWSNGKISKFLRDVFAENGILFSYADNVEKLDNEYPLYFQGVFLETDEMGFPVSANDIVVIPHQESRRLFQIAANIK